jgi:RNA polymerase sigma factor (sigma-70 family)
VISARAGVTHKDIKGERETELILRYKAGDRHAGEILLRAHVGLITHYAKRYRGNWHELDFEDLLAEAQMGFLDGVQRFDPGAGFKLSSYAPHWIRHYITRACHNVGTTIRVPVGRHDKRKNGSDDPLSRAANAALCPLRLDAPIGEGDDRSLGEVVADEDNPEAEVAERESAAFLASKLEQAMATLSPMAVEVLRRRAEGETLEEIGTSHGLSKERIRQIETLAKDRAASALRRLGVEGGEA